MNWFYIWGRFKSFWWFLKIVNIMSKKLKSILQDIPQYYIIFKDFKIKCMRHILCFKLRFIDLGDKFGKLVTVVTDRKMSPTASHFKKIDVDAENGHFNPMNWVESFKLKNVRHIFKGGIKHLFLGYVWGATPISLNVMLQAELSTEKTICNCVTGVK